MQTSKTKFLIKRLIRYFKTKKGILKFQISRDDKIIVKEPVLSTGLSLDVSINGSNYFFRFINKKENLISNLKRFICDYFMLKQISKEKTNRVLEAISTDLTNSGNVKKIKNASKIGSSHFVELISYKFRSFELVGLPSLNEIDFVDGELSTRIFQIVKSTVLEFEYNYWIKKNELMASSYNRHLATYKLANYFGLSIIPKIQKYCLPINSEYRAGFLQDFAGDGISPALLDVSKRTNVTKEFLFDILNLELFDFLCGQLDHRLDNYNIFFKDGFVCGISAFDNDEINTFSLLKKPRQTFLGCKPFYELKHLKKYYVTDDMKRNLETTTYNQLHDLLGDCLTKLQIKSLFKRMRYLSRKIHKTKYINILNKNDDIDIIKIMGDCNKKGTYIYDYLNDQSLIERNKELGL